MSEKLGASDAALRFDVDEPVAAFSSHQPETGRDIWLKVANEIGYAAR